MSKTHSNKDWKRIRDLERKNKGQRLNAFTLQNAYREDEKPSKRYK